MENKKYILFSCIGGTDPISNYSDGSMLHICRVYKPEKVYLYFSKEMIERREKDDRYMDAIKRLNKLLKINISVIYYDKPELVEVQKFGAFYDDFYSYIEKIHNENPDYTILLNISSGTPAMKTSLYFLSRLISFNVTAIQVTTPEKQLNKRNDGEYDCESFWESNLDNNSENFVNRCEIEHGNNMYAQIKLESIRQQIDAYDYEAAKRECEKIKAFVSQEALNLVFAACDRINLDTSSFKKILTKENYNKIVPVQTGNQIKLFEYMLWLQIKEKRGDTADFVRGITPALFNLSHMYLENVLKIKIDSYCDSCYHGISKLKIENLKKDEKGEKILKILNESYSENFKDSNLNSDICINIILELSPNEKDCNKFKELREFEKKIRNNIAHDITRTRMKDIQNISGKSTSYIMNIMIDLLHQVINFSESDLDCYNDMNRLIKTSLSKSSNKKV